MEIGFHQTATKGQIFFFILAIVSKLGNMRENIFSRNPVQNNKKRIPCVVIINN